MNYQKNGSFTDEQQRMRIDLEHRKLRLSSLRAKVKRVEPYSAEFDDTIAAIDRETHDIFKAQAAYEATIREASVSQA